MSTTTTELEFTKSDYGSNLWCSQNGEIFFETNSDDFLPDSQEFNENWSVSDYIDEYLSFFDLSEEQRNFASQALWSSRLRSFASDSYTKWSQDNA